MLVSEKVTLVLIYQMCESYVVLITLKLSLLLLHWWAPTLNGTIFDPRGLLTLQPVSKQSPCPGVEQHSTVQPHPSACSVFCLKAITIITVICFNIYISIKYYPKTLLHFKHFNHFIKQCVCRIKKMNPISVDCQQYSMSMVRFLVNENGNVWKSMKIRITKQN